jgi:PTH1 family peptidyl-tRNA hydrolase
MLLLVGLGNPGRRYAGHRHNIGFMAADEIHRRHRFLNESGRSVGQAMRFYKLQPTDVVVIYDELDLPPGKLRMKAGGSTAGHKGLRSIEGHIGKTFRRMRLGIGHPGSKELVNGYVLHDFAKGDQAWRDPLLAAVAENIALLERGEDATFMNRIHLATATEAEEETPRSVSNPPERILSGPFLGLRRLFGREY